LEFDLYSHSFKILLSCSLLSIELLKEKTKFSALFSFVVRQSRPPTARTSSSGSLGSESTNLAALSLDSLVAPDTPIQFDIISPVCEDQPGQAKAFGQGGR
jgi:hypothetical protein